MNDPSRVGVYYAQAFSLIYFLAEKYGQEKFHDFIQRLKNKEDPKVALVQAYREEFRDLRDMEGAWLVYFTL